MDLTTFLGAAFLVLGLLGADTLRYAGSIVLEVSPAPPMTGEVISQSALQSEFDDQIFTIAKTPSVIQPPEIRTSREPGLGMEVAQALNAKEVAYALQTAAGYAPDRLRLELFLEHGELRGQITGNTRSVGAFHQLMVPLKGETVLAFVRRAALWSASQVAPYQTALYLMQKHSADRDFSDALELIDHAVALLPPTPVSYDRGAFDNLLGIILLFQNQPERAQEAFDRAIVEYPNNPVSEINAAFADVQINLYQQAVDRMTRFTAETPPKNKILLATAYMTWGAAEMGLHRLDEADRRLAQACEIFPENSSAFALWAELKELKGDHAAAVRYEHQAMLNSAAFENYGEVATLYFHLSWKDDEPVVLSKFRNPSVVSFH